MSDYPGNPPITQPFFGGDFYVTGGTLRPDAACYVERKADKDLYDGLLQGEFCYVLTSRQMGKSSLMVRTVIRLRQQNVAVAVLDLTAIGQNLTIEQWYDGLISRLGQQLRLEDELLDYWHEHPEWGPLQRWITAIEKVVLQHLPDRVVIFVDEIDIVRSLPFSTDEFFAAIRECYNRRSREPAFNRLAFGLLGVATPTDLIRDTRTTPFNIGRRIELNDFTPSEATPLAQGLGPDSQTARRLLSRVLYWTNGHPYLTQRLCRVLVESLSALAPGESESDPGIPPVIPSVETVDQLADKLFLARQARDRDDNLIFVRERILRSEGDVAGLLYLYRKIRGGQWVPDDETNPLGCILRLSGVTRNVEGYLAVRNRIYSQVFDLNWIQTNMPEAEKRRQRKAGRRGIFVGLALAVLLLLAYVVIRPFVERNRGAVIATLTTQRLEAAYRPIQSYRDTFDTTLEIGLGNTMVPISGSGSIDFEKPDKVNLAIKSVLISPGNEIRLLSDGRASWAHAPSLRQYQAMRPPPPAAGFGFPPALAQQAGPLRVLPLYRLFLNDQAINRFQQDAQKIQYGGNAELDGQSVHILTWEHAAGALLEPLGLRRVPPASTHFPVTAWVSISSGLILQMRVDLSPWSRELVTGSSDLPVTGLVITETHRNIQTSNRSASPARFNFKPPPTGQPVDRFDLPEPDLTAMAASSRQFAKLIPARLPQAASNMVDLTQFYNASLVQSWHPGSSGNSLDALPSGLLQFAGVAFDVRGIVQLSSRQLQNAGGRFPQKVTGINVGQTCRKLHFLQAAGWRSPDGTPIGTYVLHYADGREQKIPIVYGEDVRDWNAGADRSTRVKRASMVWNAINKGGFYIRLFMTTWENPWPETEIISVDYVSTMADAGPFLIAITAEP